MRSFSSGQGARVSDHPEYDEFYVEHTHPTATLNARLRLDEYAFDAVASKQLEQQVRSESTACAGEQDRSSHVSAPGATRTNCTRIQT